MRNLYFSPESLEHIVVPEGTIQHLIMEGRFPPELALQTPRRLSIRAGHRLYDIREVVRGVSADGMWHLPLRIMGLEYKTFGEITEAEAEAGGFSSSAEAVDPQLGLPRFYEEGQHDFSSAGEVTLIWFELAFSLPPSRIWC